MLLISVKNVKNKAVEHYLCNPISSLNFSYLKFANLSIKVLLITFLGIFLQNIPKLDLGVDTCQNICNSSQVFQNDFLDLELSPHRPCCDVTFNEVRG